MTNPISYLCCIAVWRSSSFFSLSLSLSLLLFWSHSISTLFFSLKFQTVLLTFRVDSIVTGTCFCCHRSPKNSCRKKNVDHFSYWFFVCGFITHLDVLHNIYSKNSMTNAAVCNPSTKQNRGRRCKLWDVCCAHHAVYVNSPYIHICFGAEKRLHYTPEQLKTNKRWIAWQHCIKKCRLRPILHLSTGGSMPNFQSFRIYLPIRLWWCGGL